MSEGEELAREAFIREYGRTGKVHWSVYFRVLFQWQEQKALAEYQAFVRSKTL